MIAFWVSAAAGVILGCLAIAVPGFSIRRRMSRHIHDPAESQAYLEATGRSNAEIAAGRAPRHGLWDKPSATWRWEKRALARERDAETVKF